MIEKQFLNELIKLENEVVDTQSENLQKTADKISESMMQGGVVHVFGIGHSFLPSKEAFFRKGGLVPVNPIYDANLIGPFGGVSKIIALEFYEKYGQMIFEGQDTRPGEVFIQFSITGASALTTEISLEAKRRGLFTVAVTNAKYSQTLKAGHSSGKHLYEVADVVIDNCGVVGDAIMDVPGFDTPIRAGGTATITAIMIWDMLVLKVVENYCKANIEPPIINPAIIPGASERNKQLFDKYKDRLAKHF